MNTFFKPIAIAEQASTPITLPPSGFQFIYPKTDGKYYALNASGVETEITNVIGGGGSGLTHPEIMSRLSIGI